MKTLVFFDDEPNHMYKPWLELRDRGDFEDFLTIDRRAFVWRPVDFLKKFTTKFNWAWILSIPPYDFSIMPYWLASEIGKNSYFFISFDNWSEPSKPTKYYDLPLIRFFWRRYLTRESTSIICVTQESKRSLEKEIGAEVDHVLPHACNTSIYRPREVKSPNKPVVLFVGKLERHKGVDKLISISEDNPDIDFWFCGSGSMESRLREAKSKQENVKYLGYISDEKKLSRIYNRASVLALPSKKMNQWSEFFGCVLIEAMACGTPVIASNHSGPRDIVTKETGILADERFEEQLLKLLDEDLEKMGEKCRQRALENYDVDVVADKWAKILRD